MKRAFIVTGAGSGIGRAICRSLTENSDDVIVLVGRNEDKLMETRSLLSRTQEHQIVAADVADKKSLHKALLKVKVANANFCGIVVNAGVGGPNQYGESDRWDEIISTNLTGAYITAMEGLSFLRSSNSEFKHIIFISSILGKMGVSGLTAYCSAKTGLLGLTRSLALELAREKILVNSICPGWVETEMARQGMQYICDATGKSFEQVYKNEMQFVPLGKWSKPSEIGALVRYLMSPEQRSITGQAIDINNGAFMSQ